MVWLIVALVLLVAVLTIRILIALGILIFIPSPFFVSGQIVQLAKVRPGEKTVDLGSGDGRVVIAFAQAGAEAHGYEINPFLVARARRAVRQEGLQSRGFIHWGNFFFHDLSSYDVLTVFISPLAMKFLERKLRDTLKPGARMISLKFPFPSWPHTRREGDLFLYT